MPYEPHPAFTKPDNENAKIWRYMDFTKFVSLLNTKALFFSRADKLRKFDPFEGSYPVFNVKITEDELRQMIQRKMQEPDINIDLRQLMVQYTSRQSLRDVQKWIFLNCWHINEYESAAMWKLYLQSNEGIAIQSTFKRLAESFKNVDHEVNIGIVRYIDYKKDWVPYGNMFYPFLHKRKSYEHEHELRAADLDVDQPDDIDGKYISVDIDCLIEKIFVSPTSQRWFYTLVKSIVARYALGKDPVMSDLSENPVY